MSLVDDFKQKATGTLANELLSLPLIQRFAQIPLLGAFFRNQALFSTALTLVVFSYGPEILKGLWHAVTWPFRVLKERKTQVKKAKQEDILSKRLDILEKEVQSLSQAVVKLSSTSPQKPASIQKPVIGSRGGSLQV